MTAPVAPSERRPRDTDLQHPGLWAIVAVVGFVLALVVALRDPVPGWELRLTEWINDAPDGVARVAYPVMQLGTLAAILAIAAAILVLRRDWLLAAATVVVGMVAWFAAKAVKQLVERGRPPQYLPEVNVREGSGDGLGFVSGHSAVATSMAVMVVAALPRSLRPVALAVAVVVGLARIVHGVHLPADVVGGWCLGVLIALGGLELVERVQARLDGVAARG